jgi:hypothetical protein
MPERALPTPGEPLPKFDETDINADKELEQSAIDITDEAEIEIDPDVDEDVQPANDNSEKKEAA